MLSAAAAGAAKGFSGFGAAMVFMPLASALIGPHLAAPVFLLIDGLTAAPMVRAGWRLSDRREVGIITLGALVGAPVGTWLLLRSDPGTIRWAISIINLLLVVVLASGWRYRAAPSNAAALAVGSVAGVLQGVAQVSGPPVLLYWLGGPGPVARLRANAILFFAALTLITAAFYAAGGLMTAAGVVLSLTVLPAYGIGLYFGSRLFWLASETTFRRVCYALIAIAALVSLPVLDGALWDAGTAAATLR